jgi:hypothetical protein
MHNYVYHLKWWVHVCVFLSDLGTLHIPITSTWFFLPFCQMCRCESLIVIEDNVGISRRHSTAERRSMKCQLVSLGMWRFLSLFFQVNSFVSGLHQSSASLQFEGAPSILRIGLSPLSWLTHHILLATPPAPTYICHICDGHGMPWLR